MLERMQVADVAQIYQLWHEVADAVSEGDIERWLSLWADDAIQMPPGTPSRVGKADIRRGMQPLFDPLHSREMLIQPEEVRILGDRAYTHGSYRLEWGLRSGGGTKSRSGKFLTILAKQVDGSWKIAVDCHNRDAPQACV